MNVTYLGHSGFLVETKKAYYLFDYIRGKLPAFVGNKALYVFASHSHEDHFNINIFDKAIAIHTTAYILGYDIKKKFRKSLPFTMAENTAKIHWADADTSIVFSDCTVTNLKSTDMGVAFVVSEYGSNINIYHAGDLNWWHWDGEDKAWNRNMEVNFKRSINKIKTTHFDVAFVPLDPRLEGSYYYGFKYFLDNVSADNVFPMHFWKDYSVIDRYILEYGNFEQSASCIVKIQKEGQLFSLSQKKSY
jgi:L-ascorbate metabolism protein UlaG (beta-lactamase superfamily)